MISMRQPFLSIANAIIFIVLGIVFGLAGASGETIMLGLFAFSPSALWALAGTVCLMAYFSLVHLKDK